MGSVKNSSDLRQRAAEVCSGCVRARDRVQAAIGRIRRIDPDYHAFVTVCEARALQMAEKLDEELNGLTPEQARERYPLAGLTFAVKDNICVEDVRTTAASRILENYVSPYSATAVVRLEAAGAVCVGKTNLDEFAMGQTTTTGAFGATKNPRYPSLSAGGSSGGSAAAVALELVDFALGSDTGGSIRQPAALCGVTGFKPAYGTVSRYGLISYASAFDTIGPLTRSVADARWIYEVMAGPDPMDATMRGVEAAETTAGPIRIGLLGTVEGMEKLKQTLQTAFEEAGGIFAGAKPVPIELPMLAYAVPTYYIMACAQAASNLARYDGVRYGFRAQGGATPDRMYEETRFAGFSPEVRRRILMGNFVLGQEAYRDWYDRAARVRRLIYEQVAEALTQVDVIVSETLEPPYPKADFSGESEAFQAGYEQDRLTVLANLCGLPAINVCPARTGGETPLGVMVMAGAGREDVLFGVAEAIAALFGPCFKETPETGAFEGCPAVKGGPAHE